MDIAIVGPTHPYKGGIAQHTTALAHKLNKAGHQVTLVSWKTQYPFFYPGVQFVAADQPELPVFEDTRRVLSWKNPAGWWRWGKRLQQFDRIILVWWVPAIQGPVYLSLLRALGATHPPVTIICHNVLRHEKNRTDTRLVRVVFNRADQIIAHSETQAKLARNLTATPVIALGLPFSLETEPSTPKLPYKVNRQLLFFGFIRPYKGIDILLEALARLANLELKLRIIGEFWGGTEQYQKQIVRLGLQDKVSLEPGYRAVPELCTAIQQSDVVVLPYRQGTASWNVALAHLNGRPVIATSVGSFPEQVTTEVDGLLCEPDNVESLATAIRHFYEPGVAQKLQQGIKPPSIEADWQSYTQAITQG